ncbi:hypothetical protein [Streptomyces filamentosus]|uniref:hypothetical protein n=1 Tax=Streptomyces filamentosus TaxID=67294 RepID=UPI001F39FFA2|nr:hypothetical protein [Streptomyces filamentosus]
MRVLGAAVDLYQEHGHPGLRRAHHQVRPLHVPVAEPVPDLGLEAKPVADPGAVEFGGRRSDRRGLVTLATEAGCLNKVVLVHADLGKESE